MRSGLQANTRIAIRCAIWEFQAEGVFPANSYGANAGRDGYGSLRIFSTEAG